MFYARDETGRANTSLPYNIPDRFGRGDIEDAVEGLTCSIEARKREMQKPIHNGGDDLHHERLQREKSLLKKLLAALGRNK